MQDPVAREGFVCRRMVVTGRGWSSMFRCLSMQMMRYATVQLAAAAPRIRAPLSISGQRVITRAKTYRTPSSLESPKGFTTPARKKVRTYHRDTALISKLEVRGVAASCSVPH
jgi:hypothetical protein